MNRPARLALIGAALLPLVVALVCFDDPFHGDAIPNTARPALQLYAAQAPFPLIHDRFDAGHPTLFPLVLAGVWRLTGGPSLLAAHLLAAGWAWLSLLGLWRLARTAVPPAGAAAAVLLAAGGSVAVTQVALVQSALPVAGAFAWAWWALRCDRRWAFVAASVVLVLLHLEGAMLLAVLAAVDGVRRLGQVGWPDGPWLRERLLRYAPAAVVFGGWLLAHQAATGWALVSPEYAGHRGSGSPATILYNVAILGWRWLDHGYGLLWLAVFAFFIKNKNIFFNLLKEKIFYYNKTKKETNTNPPSEQPLFVLELTAAALVLSVVLAVASSGPLGHRYVLPVQWGAVVGAVLALGQWPPVGQRWGLAVVGVGLLGGHVLVYPGKCLGDATLHYRSWFALEWQLAGDWPDAPVGALAPHAAPRNVRYLSDGRGLHTVRLDEGPPPPLILVTNLSCEFPPARRDSLRQVWRALCLRRGAVEAELLVDPAVAPATLPWGPCPPDAAAAWVRQVKARLLGGCAGC